LAHSLVSPTKTPLMKELAGALDELILAVTSVAQAEHLDRLLREAGLKLPCLLALNSGLNREGARSLDQLREMKEAVDQTDSLTYRGIYSHEGHTYTSSPEEVQKQAVEVATLLRSARESFAGEGELWPGCSVTAKIMAGEEGMTGIRPGAYVYGDCFLSRRTGAMAWE